MKKSRYSDSQILAIIKQAESGVPIPELCREHGMSDAYFYKWRAKYGVMVRISVCPDSDSGVIRTRVPVSSGQAKPSLV